MAFKLVGIGEVLWDLLPEGRQLGGAPANFAYHAGALGAEAAVVSRVGDDEAGRGLVEQLQRWGVSTQGIEVDREAPTGTVSVELGADGQPRFTIHEGVAWDRLEAGAVGRQVVAAADAVCFGTLAQRSPRSREAIRALLQATRTDAWRIFDVNLRQSFYSREVIEESLAWADLLKVNETELPRLAELFHLPAGERAQLQELAERFGLRTVVHTRGGHGSLILSDREWSEHPGIATRVVDTIGAGDSFTAAMTLGLLAGWPLVELHCRATEVAAAVCSRAGGTPELPYPLRELFRRQAVPMAQPLSDLHQPPSNSVS